MAARKAPKILAAILAVSVAVVGLSAAGWYWWTVGRYHETTDNAYARGEITPISPKVAGYVRALRVADNQRVTAGEVLLRIEDQEFRLAVAEAKARVSAAKAAVANAAARIVLQGSVIEQAAADITVAEAELVRADQELARARELARKKFGTRQKYDLVEADRRKANAKLRRSRAKLGEARLEIGVLKSARDRLSAALAQSEASFGLAKTRLADTVVTAPISGIVGNRSVRLGQYVRPGNLLMAIVPLENVWVVGNFKETQLTRMRVGQSAEITVDSFPGVVLRGRVDSVSPASGSRFSLLPPENATGNFTKIVQRIPVKIVLDAGNALAGKLRPGMSVEVTVDTRREAHTGAQAREAP